MIQSACFVVVYDKNSFQNRVHILYTLPYVVLDQSDMATLCQLPSDHFGATYASITPSLLIQCLLSQSTNKLPVKLNGV